jgi:hypothetical protein
LKVPDRKKPKYPKENMTNATFSNIKEELGRPRKRWKDQLQLEVE